MPRADLLALTEDDLMTLSNRGTVKRAQRELDENSISCQLTESAAGDLSFTWSDGIVCEIPAGASLSEARCSSGSSGISRHLIRSVLTYQRSHSESRSVASTAPWDPGTAFNDDALAQHFRPAELARARQRFDTGVLVEVVRSAKPLARFLDEPCLLRFMVPGDLRYIHADCSTQALSQFVPLAVWAFRQLPAESTSGLICVQAHPLPVPVELLTELEQQLTECAVHGLAGVGSVWKQRLVRLQEQLVAAGLVWPGEILADLAEEYDRYQQHDARFSLERAVDLIGEVLIRSDAIQASRSEIPQILVRGTGADRATEISGARLVGLGCGVRTSRKSTTLTAYLQDVDTGNVVGLMRDFANQDDTHSVPRDFATLAQTPVVRGVSLAAVGAGQLLIKSGKRTPGQRLILPRVGVAANPQAFAWEKLRPPLLCESIAELTALLASLPPPSLRSRRVTEDLFVLSVNRVDQPQFDPAEQAVSATLVDGDGGQAILIHPYTTRSASGTQALLSWLSRNDARLKFVAGHARATAAGLVIAPVAAVFEQASQRILVQPWIDAPQNATTAELVAAGPGQAVQQALPAALQQWQSALAELWLVGCRRVTPPLLSQWQEVTERLERTGLIRLAETAGQVTGELAARLADPQFTGQQAAALVLYSTGLLRLAAEHA